MGVLGLRPGDPRHAVGRLLLAAALGILAGCGTPDVEERLHLELAGDGGSEVAFTVTFRSLDEHADEARRERLEALRTRYFEGWDLWGQRFARAGRTSDSVIETLGWERVGGRLTRLERTVRFDDAEQLTEFFADTDLTVYFNPSSAESELAIFPQPSTRASESERERFEELLGRWSVAAAAYLGQVADLYRYMERHEPRAPILFRAIFEDSSAGLHEHERERLDRLLEAFVSVLEIAEATDEEGDSLERLARRVHDPFPARLSVAIDGRPTARQGFVPSADGGFEIPPLGLERALSDLEAYWIEPPLLTTYERIERLGDDSGFDVEAFSALPRRIAELPTAREVAAAVEAALTPAEQYSLRWRPTSPAPENDER